MKKFRFVDFAAHFQKGFRNHVAPVSDVPDLTESFGRYGCYATYFFYSDEILTFMSTKSEGISPTVGGYQGKVWAPYFPIDIDHADFGPAIAATRFFTHLFLEKWKLPPESFQTYFSGSKGFHVMLDTRVFGQVTPSKMLPLIFSAIRRHLTLELPEDLRETVDLSIKDRVRLLRLPNTIHEKSGLHKVFLSHEEIRVFDDFRIRMIAGEPRGLPFTDATGLISTADVAPNKYAISLYERIRRQVRRITQKPFQYHFKRPADLSHLVFPCAGAQKIWESRVHPGYRNNCAIRLASEMRLLGLNEAEVMEKMFEWNERNQIDLPAFELESVVRSAFQHIFPYRYGCHDEILKHFCPLPDYGKCQIYVEKHTADKEKE